MTQSQAGQTPTGTVCIRCGVGRPAGARFCMSCGAAQAQPPCSACGAEVPAGARFCMACGTPYRSSPADTADPPPPGVAPAPVAARRVTSILFADLVGFTTLAEGRDQDDVRELLSRYFDNARHIVARYGGTIEKFIGDAVMAVWGVPTAHEDDAERAVRAGLELTHAIAGMRADTGVPGLDVRVGIVTGEVAVTLGATGQGMVAGDPVNTASRVQSVAEPGQVWVDETTRFLTNAAISYADAGSHRLKGKSEPLALWAVRAVVADIGGAQRTDAIVGPLVGRDRELRLIKELYHRTEETRQPAMLVVASDPGLGKTRLGWEFSTYADGLTDTVRWLEGRCVAYGESVAYYGLAEAIRGRLRSLSPEAGDEQVPTESLLELALDTFVPDPGERDWIRPRLGVLLGGGGSFQQQDLFGAWIAFLRRLGDDAAAVVLLIDDAQHADDGLIDFLEEALRAGGLPLFVLLLTRHELLQRHPALATDHQVSMLHLSALSDPQMATLVGGIVDGLPDRALHELVTRADGVPLYAIETIRSMADRDLVVPRDDRYVLAADDLDLTTIGAPASLQSLIAARLDALDAAQRMVVDYASVLGQNFRREPLLALLGGRAEDLDSALEELVHRQIFSRDTNRLSNTFGSYGFMQDVVRQVAYGMLARRDRRAAHLRVVEHLGDAGDGLAAMIAQHLIGAAEAMPAATDVADLRLRARDLLVTASHRTLSLGQATGAVAQLTTAMGLCETEVDRARVETLLARALGTERNFAEQITVATRALNVLDAHEDPEEAAMAAGHLGFALDATGRSSAALTLLRPRWDSMVARGADEPICLVGRYLLLALQHSGRHDEIVPVALTTLAAAERLGDELAILRILEALALACSALRLPHLAQGIARLVADVAEGSDSGGSDFSGLALLAVHDMRRDLRSARRRIDAVDEVIESNRLLSSRGWLTMDRLLLELSSGDWAAVDAAYDGFAEFAEAPEMGSYAFVGMKLALARDERFRPEWESPSPDRAKEATLGDLLADSLRTGRAPATDSDLLRHVVEQAGVQQGDDNFVFLIADCADLLVAAGSTAATRAVLELLPASDTDRTVEPAVRAHRARIRGLLARMEGAAPGVAEAHLREAIEAYDAWGGHLWARRTAADLADILMRDGRAPEAAGLLVPVRELYRSIGATTWLAELPDL